MISPPGPTPDGLRHSMVVPKWLANRAGRNAGYRFLYTMARTLDIFWEWAFQGTQAWWPGVGTPTALPYIGRSRGILRGEADTDADFDAKLIAWLDTWDEWASNPRLAKEISGYLANKPLVRVVNRAGFWITLNTDGTVTSTSPTEAAWAWDWDSVSNPRRTDGPTRWWSDLWIIVYPTEWPIAPTVAARATSVHDGQGLGHTVPRTTADQVLALVQLAKASHTFIQAIVWSYDATLFDPASVNAGNPDGTWGYPGKFSGGSYVPARTGAADGRVRYWEPVNG